MFIQPSSEERCRRERERERGDEAPLSSIRPSSRGVACTIFSGPHRPCARARRPTDLDRWRSDLPRPRNLCADARRETHLLPLLHLLLRQSIRSVCPPSFQTSVIVASAGAGGRNQDCHVEAARAGGPCIDAIKIPAVVPHAGGFFLDGRRRWKKLVFLCWSFSSLLYSCCRSFLNSPT